MPEEIEKIIVGEINVDVLEAAFVGEEAVVEEDVFIVGSVDEEEDTVDLAFQEDEGYW
jgi:hypothetical protein